MLEDLEDEFAFLFGGFLSTGQFTLLLALYLLLEVLMEVVLQVIFQLCVLGHVLNTSPKLLARCLFGHLKVDLFEVVLDQPLYDLVLFSHLVHEVLEDLMG